MVLLLRRTFFLGLAAWVGLTLPRAKGEPCVGVGPRRLAPGPSVGLVGGGRLGLVGIVPDTGPSRLGMAIGLVPVLRGGLVGETAVIVDVSGRLFFLVLRFLAIYLPRFLAFLAGLPYLLLPIGPRRLPMPSPRPFPFDRILPPGQRAFAIYFLFLLAFFLLYRAGLPVGSHLPSE